MLLVALLLGIDPATGLGAALAQYEQIARSSLASAPQAAIAVCSAVAAASLKGDQSGVQLIERYKGSGHTILSLECQGYMHGMFDALSAAGRSAKP